MKRRALAVAVLALGGSVASAGSSLGTLQDLINDGSTGVTVGDKQYYNFSYMGSVDAVNIAVTPNPAGQLGLEFGFNWSSTAGVNQDSAIRYSVHVLDNNPITAVGLHFNGAAAGNSGLLTNASVTETVNDINNNEIGQISVFNAGANFSSMNRSDATLQLAAGVRDLMLTKDIAVHSSSFEGGTATIGAVDNTFVQTTPGGGPGPGPGGSAVPLPPAAWTGLSTLALLAAGRLKRKARSVLGA